jgi:hypothetical protein
VIIEVEEVDCLVAVAEIVSPEINLNAAGGILDVSEDHFSFRTPAFYSSGDGHLRSIVSHVILVSCQSRGRHMSALVAVRERLNAKRLEGGALLSSSHLDI